MSRELFFLVLTTFIIGTNGEFHKIFTKLGIIQGTVETNVIDGTEYYAYRGIRYAKKLTEETKFQDSKPVKPWRGILNATKSGNNCITVGFNLDRYTGDIDCLFMNVYVPKNRTRPHEPLSSLFFIHGGAFVIGSGDDSMYGPEYLIRWGVILVTINYRLGPFGFLNLGTALSPGNMALKDQTRALKFYKEIIAEAVGGDPNEITIQGGSAGAASVSYHIISPMSRGLFKGVILESGSSLAIWAYDNNLTRTFERTKKIFNLTSNDPEEVAQELTKRPAKEIAQNFSYYVSLRENLLIGALTYVPSKEKRIKGVEMFLDDSPHNIMFRGTFSRVPILIGVNSDDGISFAGIMKDAIGDDPTNAIHALPYNMSELFDDVDSAFRLIYKQYKEDTVYQRNNLFLGDVMFFFDTWITVNLYVGYRIPAYFFYFQYRTTNALLLAQGVKEKVCAHGDQGAYIFYSHLMKNKYLPGTTEYNLTTDFTKAWTSFTKIRNPTPANSDNPWKMYNEGKSVMTIDPKFILANVTTLEKDFNSRMCYILSFMKEPIQERFKSLQLC